MAYLPGYYKVIFEDGSTIVIPSEEMESYRREAKSLGIVGFVYDSEASRGS